MREVVVTYCDYCGKEIKDHSWSGKEYADGRKLDFHSVYIDENHKTCLQKHEEEEIKKYLKSVK